MVSSSPNPELGIDIISHFDPVDAAEQVETNLRPIVYFNVPLDEDISIQDINGNAVTYKAQLTSAKLFSEEGFDLDGKIEYSNDKKRLTFMPGDLLSGNNEHTFTVEVDIYKNCTFLSNESKSVTFTTGDILDYIPEANILAAYPMNGICLLYTSPSPRDQRGSRMPSSA